MGGDQCIGTTDHSHDLTSFSLFLSQGLVKYVLLLRLDLFVVNGSLLQHVIGYETERLAHHLGLRDRLNCVNLPALDISQ